MEDLEIVCQEHLIMETVEYGGIEMVHVQVLKFLEMRRSFGSIFEFKLRSIDVGNSEFKSHVIENL